MITHGKLATALVALLLLAGITVEFAVPSRGLVNAAEPPKTAGRQTMMKLAADQIPAAERYPWQPKELVAIIGSHNFRHWGTVNAVAFSPDGASLATSSGDGFVRLWNGQGHELAALKTPAEAVNSVAFSPDGKTLIAGSEDGVLYGWRLRTGAPESLAPFQPSLKQPTFQAGRPAIDAIEFAADGRRMACSVGRQTGVRVVLWDCTVWPMRELPAINDATGPFAFNVDGKTLVTQQGQGGIAVWDLSGAMPEKKSFGQPAQPRGQMLTMAIAPMGDRVATCYGDGAAGRFTPPGEATGDVVLWDLAINPPKPVATFGAFKNDPMFYMIRAAGFSKDGKTLAFAAKSRNVELWNVGVNPPKSRGFLPGTIAQAGAVAFSPAGKTLAGVGDGLMFWDLSKPSPELVTNRGPYIRAVVLSPDGGHLATFEQGTKKLQFNTKLWSLTEGSPQPQTVTLNGMPVLFGADGTLLTVDTAGSGGAFRPSSLRRYDVSGAAPRDLGTMELPPTAIFHGRLGAEAASAIVLYGEQTGDQLTLWRGNGSGEFTPCKLSMPETHEVFNAVSADGDRIVTVVGDFQTRAAKVWDISGAAAKEKATVRGAPVVAPTHVTSVEVSVGADGNRIEKAHIEEGPSESRPFQLWTVTLAPDGRAVALADLEGTIQVWQLTDAEPRLSTTLAGHRQEQVMGAVQHMAFDNDGKQLVSVGSDRKIIVWNLATGKPVYSTVMPGVALDARFAADQRHLLTLNPDGTLYVLRLPEN